MKIDLTKKHIHGFLRHKVFITLDDGVIQVIQHPPLMDALLMETGDYLLLETGDYILLEA